MSFKESFNTALLNLINSDNDRYAHYTSPEVVSPAVEVLDYSDSTYSSGYCDTCWFEYTVLEIVYEAEDGETRKFIYADDFGDLIDTLMNMS